VQHEQERAVVRPAVTLAVVVSVLQHHLPQPLSFVEQQLLSRGLGRRLLLLLLLFFLLLGVLLEFGLRGDWLGPLVDFGEDLLLGERLLLAGELDLEEGFGEWDGLGLDDGVVERVPELLLELLFLERDGLPPLDGVDVNGYFGDAVAEDGAGVGVDYEEAGVVLEVAGVGQFGGVVAGGCHPDLVRHRQLGLVVAVPQNVYFVVPVKDGCCRRECHVPVTHLPLCNMLHSPARSQFLLVEDGLLGQVEQVDAARLVAGQQVVVGVGGGRESSDAVGVQGVLRVVLLDGALVVLVLALLLDLEQPETELVEDGFGEDLCDEAVGLRELVLAVVGIADLPFIQVQPIH